MSKYKLCYKYCYSITFHNTNILLSFKRKEWLQNEIVIPVNEFLFKETKNKYQIFSKEPYACILRNRNVIFFLNSKFQKTVSYIAKITKYPLMTRSKLNDHVLIEC